MAKQSKQEARAREALHRGLVECEDRAVDREAVARLRRMREKIAGSEAFSIVRSEEMRACVEEFRSVAAKAGANVRDVYLTRLETMMDLVCSGQEEKGARRNVFQKLKSMFGKEKANPTDARLRSQEEDAEQKIFALEKKIAGMSEERQKLMAQFEEKVKKCAGLAADSYDYKITRQQAMILKTRISGLEQQIEMHAKLLENNAKYQTMLINGRTTFEIRSYMPDTAEADMLMQMIADETQEVIGDTEDFGGMVDSYSSAIERAMPNTAFAADDEFDRMVREAKQEQTAEIQVPEQPVPAQPAAVQVPEPTPEQPAETPAADENGKDAGEFA